MNQGFEAVEYIRGNRVAPADEPLLRKKFSVYKRARTVGEGLALIQRHVPLLAGITTLQLREFLIDSDIRTPARGDVIFARNDYSDTFFCIIEGQVEVEIVDESGKKERDIVLGAGEFFGELSLISGRRRAATVRAGQDCVLLETPRRSMVKLIASVDSVRRTIDTAFLKHTVLAHLSQELLQGDVDTLIANAQLKTYAAGETLFAEGDAADGLYLLRRGIGRGVAPPRRARRRALLCRRRQLHRRDGAAVGRAADGHGEARRSRPRRSCSTARDSRTWWRGSRRCARSSRAGSSSASARTCRWSRTRSRAA